MLNGCCADASRARPYQKVSTDTVIEPKRTTTNNTLNSLKLKENGNNQIRLSMCLWFDISSWDENEKEKIFKDSLCSLMTHTQLDKIVPFRWNRAALKCERTPQQRNGENSKPLRYVSNWEGTWLQRMLDIMKNRWSAGASPPSAPSGSKAQDIDAANRLFERWNKIWTCSSFPHAGNRTIIE